MIEQIDWARIENLGEQDVVSEVFSILQDAAFEIQRSGDSDEMTVALVPRLLDLRERRPEINVLEEPLAALARSVGLWNYLDELQADTRERLISEAARVTLLSNRILHREQWRALDALLGGQNVILSAPTSFGKSLLIDALIVSGTYSRVAVVVPTIALLDETRRRLLKACRDTHDIVSHHSEAPTKDKVVFVGTQERLIARQDIENLDLLVVDEFYKLDPARKDDRSATLNAAVYKLLNVSKQFFFLGPNIDSITFDNETPWRFQFLRTRFATVAVDTLDLTRVEDRKARLVAAASSSENWPTLVFASSPDRANELMNALRDSDATFGVGAPLLADWMRSFYSPKWPLCNAMQQGIAVHHGRVPRALASKTIREFNAGNVGVLVCTSTLIEGVNTAARSVMIYDKKISRADYDFFTFSNIRGRAGRLGEHYVGRVFLFNEPPETQDISVEPPLFGNLDKAPDDLVVHIEQTHLHDAGNTRVAKIANDLGLSVAEIRRFSALSVAVLREFKFAVEARQRRGRLPIWLGYPQYQDIADVCEIICEVKSPMGDFGVASHKQLTFFLNRLRLSGTLLEFFEWYGGRQLRESSEFDRIFKFLRACEYGLGEYFSVVQSFVNSMSEFAADYSLFVAEMQNFFRPECLKVLDERGIPIQISERVYRNNDTTNSVASRLLSLANENSAIFSQFEREWIKEALVD